MFHDIILICTQPGSFIENGNCTLWLVWWKFPFVIKFLSIRFTFINAKVLITGLQDRKVVQAGLLLYSRLEKNHLDAKILRNGFRTMFSTFTKMEWNFHISAVTNFTTKIRICTLNWMYLEWNVKRKKVVLERWAWYIYNYPAAVKSKFASADHLHCWSVVQLCCIRNVEKAMTAFTITRVEPVLEVGWILCVHRLLVDSNKQNLSLNFLIEICLWGWN